MGTTYSTSYQEPENIECTSIPGLQNDKVLTFCESNREMLPSVAEGARIGIFECQVQFQGRRWNCSTIEGDESVFGNVLNIGEIFLAWKRNDTSKTILIFRDVDTAFSRGYGLILSRSVVKQATEGGEKAGVGGIL